MLWVALLTRSDLSTPPPDDDKLRGLSMYALQFSPRVAIVEDAVVIEVDASARLFGQSSYAGLLAGTLTVNGYAGSQTVSVGSVATASQIADSINAVKADTGVSATARTEVKKPIAGPSHSPRPVATTRSSTSGRAR